ncbi:MAG: hypothetical protein AAF541_12350 [Pseudomonadota bacterium]
MFRHSTYFKPQRRRVPPYVHGFVLAAILATLAGQIIELEHFHHDDEHAHNCAVCHFDASVTFEETQSDTAQSPEPIYSSSGEVRDATVQYRTNTHPRAPPLA